MGFNSGFKGLNNKEMSSHVSGSHRGVGEDSDILGCDAEWDSGSRNFEGKWAATGPTKHSQISQDMNHPITLKFVEIISYATS